MTTCYTIRLPINQLPFMIRVTLICENRHGEKLKTLSGEYGYSTGIRIIRKNQFHVLRSLRSIGKT